MRLLRYLSILSSVAITSSFLFVTPNVYAGTNLPKGTLHAEIDGKHFPAIAVGDVTYLERNALDVFHTPYQYLGNDNFAVTGGTIQGVSYQGNVYLPWDSVAPKVKATPLPGGGFNFTAIPVSHHYHLAIGTQDGTIGSPDILQVFVTDGAHFVPGQTVQISLNGHSHVAGYDGKQFISVQADQYGSWYGGMNDTVAETVHPIVVWADPSGNVHNQTLSIDFSKPTSPPQPMFPLNENLIATVPVTIYQNALLFNAKSSGKDVMFQLDTGAYEPLINQQDAQMLHLPNLGNGEVAGVGGEDKVYRSELTLSIDGHQFENVPCLVDENYHKPSLLGYGFFVSHGYDLLVSQKEHSISILK